MNRAELALLLFAALVLSSCVRRRVIAATDENTGLIEGTVQYEDGNPVNGATVYAQPMGRRRHCGQAMRAEYCLLPLACLPKQITLLCAPASERKNMNIE